MIKYTSVITAIGDCALEFLHPDCNFLIIFNDDAPAELAEISLLHTKSVLQAPPKAGDILYFHEQAYEITAVGEEALHTLAQLGHCAISFSGSTTALRPGNIEIKGAIPAADIQVGCRLQIISGEER